MALWTVVVMQDGKTHQRRELFFPYAMFDHGAPQFARLEGIPYREQRDVRRMRVATRIGTSLDSPTRRYEREAT